MESLPFELVEKILAYLTYHDCRRVLTVSKRWNMVVKGLLPPKTVNITGQRKNKSKWKMQSVLGEYNLYSSYKGNPVYISNCTRNIRTGKHRQYESWMYLFKMEKVWYEEGENQLFARHDSWRWYVGENVGVVSINDGFLQSKTNSINPPENGSAWSWFQMPYYGWCGNGWPSHPNINKIDFIDDEEPKGAEDEKYDTAAKQPELSAKKEKSTIKKKGPLFHPLPLIPEYKTKVLVSHSGGDNDSMTLHKDEVVLLLGQDDNGKTEVRKGNGEEGMVPNFCIREKIENDDESD